MADIYIKLGYEFQQPYIARANSNAQSATIGRTPSTYSFGVPSNAQQPNIRNIQQPNIVSIIGQQPSTYQHRSPGTYSNIGTIAYPFRTPNRSPFTSQSPSIVAYPFRQPFTYNFRVPSTSDQPGQNVTQTYTTYPYIFSTNYRYPTSFQSTSPVRTPSIVGTPAIIQVPAQQPLGFVDVSVQNPARAPSRAAGNTQIAVPQIYQVPSTAQISYRYTIQATGIIPYSFNFRTLLIGRTVGSIPAIYITRAIYVYIQSFQVLVPTPYQVPSPYIYQNPLNIVSPYPFRYPYTGPAIVRYTYFTGPKLEFENQGLTNVQVSKRGSTVGYTTVPEQQPFNGITQAPGILVNGASSPVTSQAGGRYTVAANYNFIFQQAFYYRQPTIGNGNIPYPYIARTPARNLVNVQTNGNTTVRSPTIYQVPSRVSYRSPSIYVNSIRSSFQQPAPYIKPVPQRAQTFTARVPIDVQNPGTIQFDTLGETQIPSRTTVIIVVGIQTPNIGNTRASAQGNIPLRSILNEQQPNQSSAIGTIPYEYIANAQTPVIRNKQTPYPYSTPNRSPFTYNLRSPFIYQNSLTGNTQITYPYRSPFTYQSTYQNTRPIGPIARVKDVYLNQGGIVNKAQEVYLNDSNIVKKIHDAE